MPPKGFASLEEGQRLHNLVSEPSLCRSTLIQSKSLQGNLVAFVERLSDLRLKQILEEKHVSVHITLVNIRLLIEGDDNTSDVLKEEERICLGVSKSSHFR